MSPYEIVDKIRENTNDVIKSNNELFGDIALYKQPDIETQALFINSLIDNNVNVQVINCPVGLIELNGEEGQVTIESYRYEYHDGFTELIDMEKVKSVIFYMWIIIDKLEEKETNGFIRFKCFDEKWKLKEFSVA